MAGEAPRRRSHLLPDDRLQGLELPPMATRAASLGCRRRRRPPAGPAPSQPASSSKRPRTWSRGPRRPVVGRRRPDEHRAAASTRRASARATLPAGPGEHVDLEHGHEAGVAERQAGGVAPRSTGGAAARRRSPWPGSGPALVGQVNPDDLAAAAVQGQRRPGRCRRPSPAAVPAGRRPPPAGRRPVPPPPGTPGSVVEPGGPVEGDAHTIACGPPPGRGRRRRGRGRRAIRRSMRPSRRVTARRRSHRSTATPSPVAWTSTQFTG